MRNYQTLLSASLLQHVLKSNSGLTLLRKGVIDYPNMQKLLVNAERDCAILLHHDAITGTNYANVEKDYFRWAGKAIEQLSELQTKLMEPYYENSNDAKALLPEKSLLMFKNLVDHNRIKSHRVVRVFNPSLYERHEVVNITSSSQYTAILSPAGAPLRAEMLQPHEWRRLFSDMEPSAKPEEWLVFFETGPIALSYENFIVLELLKESDCTVNGL